MDKANSAIGQVPRPVMQRIIRNASIKPHVAIVGAGFAGLRCADVLLKSGAKVTIYEARDRVGGRVSRITDIYSNILYLPNTGTSRDAQRKTYGHGPQLDPRY